MKKRLLLIFLSLMLVVGMFAGCGEKKDPAPDTSSKGEDKTDDTSKDKTEDDKKEDDKKDDGELEHVELNWYLGVGDRPDTAIVLEEVQKMIKDELNATLNMHINTRADHNTKISTMLSAGQEMDILFTSTSVVPYLENAKRGAFLPLEDLLPEYAPEIYKSIPEEAWDAVTVDGHIYGIIPMKDLADVYSISYDQKIFEKYDIEAPESGSWTSLYEWEDVFYGAYEARNQEHPDLADEPLFKRPHFRLETFSPYELVVAPVGITVPGLDTFEGKGSGDTAFNFYDTPEYLEYCKLMRKFVEDGILPEDAPNYDLDGAIQLEEPLFIGQGHVVPLTTKPEWEVVGYSMTAEERMLMTTAYVQAALNAISATSKNPERALMVMEYISKDEYLGTVIRFGIEDTHWKDIGDGYFTFEGTANSDPTDWAYRYWYGADFGSITNMKVPEGTHPDFQDKIKDLVNICNKDTALGFVFDPAPVQNEIAACKNVIDEYDALLKFGALKDVEAEVAEFVAKLKENGSEKIVDEVQKQLDEWRESVGK